MKDKSYKRHVAKAITWRIVGTLDTILLGWLISGDSLTGFKIGLAEVLTKTVHYYFHERFWFKGEFSTNSGKWSSRKRHLAKTFSWRLVGTLDTILLAWVITGNPVTGLQIGLAEVATKMLLYYLHERTWYRTDFGVAEKRKSEDSRKGILMSKKFKASRKT